MTAGCSIGKTAGRRRICYYENMGNSEYPDYELVTEDFLELNLYSGYVFFQDIDEDSDYDMFYGTNRGGIRFYRNLADPLKPEISIALEGRMSSSPGAVSPMLSNTRFSTATFPISPRKGFRTRLSCRRTRFG